MHCDRRTWALAGIPRDGGIATETVTTIADPQRTHSHTDLEPIDVPAASSTGDEGRFLVEPGVRIADFTVLRRVAAGGMGTVYEAENRTLGRRVAIKVIRADGDRDRIAIARLLREAQAVNRVRHPNIVDIYDIGELPDGRGYLVMSWLEGETLQDRIQRCGGLELDEAIRLLLPIVSAVQAAHAAGVVHRDLKPANIFLESHSAGEQVKVLDFGLAKFEDVEGLTTSHALLGTPSYLSPEQARSSSVDHRTDIYSLGIVAFEMLTGTLPFRGRDRVSVLAKHATAAPPRLLEERGDLPPEVAAVVRGMMSKDPAERPSLAEVRAALTQAAAVPTPLPRPATAPVLPPAAARPATAPVLPPAAVRPATAPVLLTATHPATPAAPPRLPETRQPRLATAPAPAPRTHPAATVTAAIALGAAILLAIVIADPFLGGEPRKEPAPAAGPVAEPAEHEPPAAPVLRVPPAADPTPPPSPSASRAAAVTEPPAAREPRRPRRQRAARPAPQPPSATEDPGDVAKRVRHLYERTARALGKDEDRARARALRQAFLEIPSPFGTASVEQLGRIEASLHELRARSTEDAEP